MTHLNAGTTDTEWWVCQNEYQLETSVNVIFRDLFDPSAFNPCMKASQPNLAQSIQPGWVWPDDRGKHIQAHGGAVIRVDDSWFWFGEDRSLENDPETCCVACYASRDLFNWEFRNQVFVARNPAGIEGLWQIERPKVFRSATTGQFVMYMHLDGQEAGHGSRYRVAQVAIAVSDTVDGNYQYVRSFRPFDKESRDIGQFIDDDGSSYLIFECRADKGFYIASLTENCMDVDQIIAFVQAPIEGGAIVKYEDLYYCIGSQLTGWWPNANQYATAKNLSGPWSDFKDFAPPETQTWGSQSSNLLKIRGSEKTTVIYIGDIWRPYELHDSRYLWYPLELGNGSMQLKPLGWQPGPWTIDVSTGIVTLLE